MTESGQTLVPFSTPPQDVVVRVPSREAAHFRRVNGTLSGDISSTANMLTIWDPTEGHRAVLRGGILTAMFSTKGSVSGVNHLMILDVGSSPSTQCMVTLGVFATDSPRGQVICLNQRFDLLEGQWASARDSLVRIGSNASIGTGGIRVTGVVWGTEIAQ